MLLSRISLGLVVLLACCCLSGKILLAEETAPNKKAGATSNQKLIAPLFIVALKGPDQGTWIHVFDKKSQEASQRRQLSNPFTLKGDRSYPLVAAQTDGSSVAIWQVLDRNWRGGDVIAQHYSKNGKEKGPEIIVAKLNQGSELAITALPKDRYFIFWTVGKTIWGQKYNKELQPVHDGSIKVNVKNIPTHLGVTSMQDGSVILSWRDGDRNTCSSEKKNSINLQVLNPTGLPVGQPKTIADYSNSICHGAARRTGPEIAAIGNNRAVITWREGDGRSPESEEIMAAVVNGQGRITIRPYRVNEPTPYRLEQYSSVAGLKSGGFVIIWTSVGIGHRGRPGPEINTPSVIRGQLFDRDAKKVGHEFIVNTSLNAKRSSVTGIIDGGFTVVWYGCVVDGNGCQVNYHVYDMMGKSESTGNIVPNNPNSNPTSIASPYQSY